MTTILEDVMDLINMEHDALGVPVAYLDFLGVNQEEGTLSIQSIQSTKVIKAYIDGSGEYQTTFRLAIRKKAGTASSAVSLETIEALEVLAALFLGMNDYRFPSDRVIRRGEVTTPSLLYTDDQGFSTYGVSVTLTYAEGV